MGSIIIVFVPTQYQSGAVQRACREHGIFWCGGRKDFNSDPVLRYGDETCICVDLRRNEMTYGERYYFAEEEPNAPIISCDEFFANVEKYLAGKKPDPEVTNITTLGFNIGDIFVSWKMYDEIGEIRNQKMEDDQSEDSKKGGSSGV